MIDRVAIPGYRVVRPLATGGMGAVFEVEKLATRKRFAAKFLHEHLATEREYRLRFEREVGALCAVRHPHIVNIFGWRLPGVGEGGKPYILMELLHGEGLDQLLAREVALPPRRAISTLLQVLDGLTAAHQSGVIHRDLGPSNVFLVAQPEGEPLVKLLDFGLAGPVGGGEARTNVTQAGTVMGKPAYVAPEMFESKQIDARSDIFACGVLLFRMVAGRLPYREQESSLLWIERYAERQQPRDYPALHDVLASVPDCLDEACSHAMRRNPDDRYRSAREMQLALLDVDTELGRLAGETSESSMSWSEASQPDQPLGGAVPGTASTIAFTVAPGPDEPLVPKGGATPLPRSVEAMGPSAEPVLHVSRKGPIVIDPKKTGKRDDQIRVSTAWEVVPAPKPPSTPRRTERSGSSVIARSVPAGPRSFVLRPAVLAAAVVLLTLTVALVVIFSKSTEPSGGGLPPVVAPSTPAVAEPAPDAALPAPVPPVPPPAPDAAAPRPLPPVVIADAAAGTTIPGMVRIVIQGLPADASASFNGAPFAGRPLEIVVPRSSSPWLLRVGVPGYEVYESQVAPTSDMTISVPLVRVPGSVTPPPPVDRTPPGGTRRPPGGDRVPRDLPPRDPGTGPTSPALPLPEDAPW